MAFEGLKERLKEQWNEISAKVQETSAYNSLREQFESQPVNTQRAIIAAVIAIVALFFLNIPYSYISESSDIMTQFEENRDLIRGLLRASRTANEAAPLPPPQTFESLRPSVEAVIREKRLLPEQVGDMQAVPGTPAPNLAPATITQNGIVVQLKKVNVAQIVELSNAFQNMGPGIKLIGLDIVQTAGQTHYYDMIAKIVHFGLENKSDEPDDNKGRGKRRPKKAIDEGESE